MLFWLMGDLAQATPPSLEEAYARLKKYEAEGASQDAFGWQEIMDEDRMRALRCA